MTEDRKEEKQERPDGVGHPQDAGRAPVPAAAGAAADVLDAADVPDAACASDAGENMPGPHEAAGGAPDAADASRTGTAGENVPDPHEAASGAPHAAAAPCTAAAAAPVPAVSCEVCRDLLPLVCDGVASADSEAIVKAHTAGCEACRALLTSGLAGGCAEPCAPDDARVLQSLRRKLVLRSTLFALAGAVGGALVMRVTGNSAYVLWWLPLVGMLSYFGLRRRWWLAPLLTGALVAAGCFGRAALGSAGFTHGFDIYGCVLYPLSNAILWAMLTAVGAAVGVLLNFALGKGEKHENR